MSSSAISPIRKKLMKEVNLIDPCKVKRNSKVGEIRANRNLYHFYQLRRGTAGNQDTP